MKKFLSVLLILCMVFSLAACQKAEPDDEMSVLDDFGPSDNSEPDDSADPDDPDDDKTPDPQDPSEEPDQKDPSDPSTDDHQHQWADATCTLPKTCSDCGETEGDALGHDMKAATCTAEGTCSRCDATQPMILHTYQEGVCSVCGAKEPASEGNHTHAWAAATCQAPQTCTGCGATTGKTINHNRTPANCEKGIHCSMCDTSFSDPLGHAFVNETCENCNTTITLPIAVEYKEDLGYDGNAFVVRQVDILDIDLLEEGESRVEVFTQCTDAGENYFRVSFYDKNNIMISETILGDYGIPGDTQLCNTKIPANTAKIVVDNA